MSSLFQPGSSRDRSDAFGERGPLTVSELNREVREVLREAWPEVWVEGEVSNFKAHGSGHWYFRLKDDASSIDAAMFRGDNRRCRFEPEDGLQVVVRGGLELYLPRGAYQIVVREMLPKGVGALQLAFEQLKKRLEGEGLFDPARKRPLPPLPRRVGIVTSRDGAALRDILHVVRRRFANVELLLAPCRVQGDGAAEEIAAAVELLDGHGSCDVLIVGRGGGSIEDLWAFNEEVVARAIAACGIPVISAVGHETDTTISDLVADVRAPTPSAAAEQVVDRRDLLEKRVETGRRGLVRAMRLAIRTKDHAQRALAAEKVFRAFALRLENASQRVDDLDDRRLRAVRDRLALCRERAERLGRRLTPRGLRAGVRRRAEALERSLDRLAGAGRRRIERDRDRLGRATAALDALSPLGVLDRGYALVRHEGRVLREAGEVEVDEALEILLESGELTARVEEVRPDERPARPPRDASNEEGEEG